MKLITYITNNNISIKELSLILNVSQQSIYKWIRGTVPRRQTIIQIKTLTKGSVDSGDFY
jgi:hypothetical protein